MSLNKHNLIIGILLFIQLSGCSWLGDAEEPENDSYKAGKKALNEGKFELAKAKLREITPESPYYPQAVWMIQKVPFNKGIDAYQKQYRNLRLKGIYEIKILKSAYLKHPHL